MNSCHEWRGVRVREAEGEREGRRGHACAWGGGAGGLTPRSALAYLELKLDDLRKQRSDLELDSGNACL